MSRCEDYRTQMVAFVRGELRALEYARIETHLERCASCSAAEKHLREGLGAAAKYAPKLDPQHLERLVRRLAPYVEQAQPPPLLPRIEIILAPAAVAAAIALMFVLPSSEQAPSPAPAIAEAPQLQPQPQRQPQSQPQPQPQPPAPVTIVKKTVTKHLRVVASSDWNGRVEQTSAKNTSVEMERGFAVMSFDGGAGRILAVETPEVSVEAIGSKFFVSVVRPGLTTIGVVSGRVRVKTPAGVEDLEAGRTRAWTREGSPATEVPAASIPSVDFEDEFLDKPAAAKPVETASLESAPIELAKVELPEPKPIEDQTPPIDGPPDSGPAIPPPPPPIDIYAELARAEQLTSAGRASDALAAYEKLLSLDESAPHASLIRYEIARLHGFHLGDAGLARRTFSALAVQETSEVGTQAAFAMCELDLARDRCAAFTCLEKLAESAIKSGVKREAQELARRWGLAQNACADHKSNGR